MGGYLGNNAAMMQHVSCVAVFGVWARRNPPSTIAAFCIIAAVVCSCFVLFHVVDCLLHVVD
jgi:hypothetical protein